MSLPSRKQQIDAVAKFLDSERNEGRTLEDIAAEIVDGYLAAITPASPALPLREGMLVKSPITAKVYRVVWLREGLVWAVGDTAGYGWLGSDSEDFWKRCEEYRPKRRVVIDGKGKMVEMSDSDIEEEWANEKYSVGDQVSQRQRQFIFEIIATGPQCVLMRNVKTDELVTDSNRNLEQYYRKEVRGAAEW